MFLSIVACSVCLIPYILADKLVYISEESNEADRQTSFLTKLLLSHFDQQKTTEVPAKIRIPTNFGRDTNPKNFVSSENNGNIDIQQYMHLLQNNYDSKKLYDKTRSVTRVYIIRNPYELEQFQKRSRTSNNNNDNDGSLNIILENLRRNAFFRLDSGLSAENRNYEMQAIDPLSELRSQDMKKDVHSIMQRHEKSNKPEKRENNDKFLDSFDNVERNTHKRDRFDLADRDDKKERFGNRDDRPEKKDIFGNRNDRPDKKARFEKKDRFQNDRFEKGDHEGGIGDKIEKSSRYINFDKLDKPERPKLDAFDRKDRIKKPNRNQEQERFDEIARIPKFEGNEKNERTIKSERITVNYDRYDRNENRDREQRGNRNQDRGRMDNLDRSERFSNRNEKRDTFDLLDKTNRMDKNDKNDRLDRLDDFKTITFSKTTRFTLTDKTTKESLRNNDRKRSYDEKINDWGVTKKYEWDKVKDSNEKHGSWNKKQDPDLPTLITPGDYYKSPQRDNDYDAPRKKPHKKDQYNDIDIDNNDWDIKTTKFWSEPDTKWKAPVKKKERDDYHDYNKPRREPRVESVPRGGAFGFGRTPAPFRGKKNIYEEINLS